ncbi:GNAT family N-acetyltransferase [Pantoea sp. Mb-10]|uniref:tRNA(Met) cytidine acetyltransferase TmcA n=1 Tax=unclassified Pantoea TaxID=2630326 RepID=UPI001E5844C4|nr:MULTISPECIES: GNAT family N-acetyltransferase [unclassified Pantoea]MCE0489229.1 GNAT family N-acetyltransferase [Pantoea sp. Mb-10]MCE0503022.1 GNAT family N-acetyltransferase [Pantoea sp. Pb-8]
MSPSELTAELARAGIRGLCVIAGEPDWALAQSKPWQRQLPGDWLTLSDAADWPERESLSAFRQLLGREFQHAIFDARRGFHAEAFAALAGTLRAGSWLLLLVPPWPTWAEQLDDDSLRWADVAQPIATPHFIRHLQACLLRDPDILLVRQGEPPRLPRAHRRPAWQHTGPQQQANIMQQLLHLDAGVAVLTAARGRGKSALAGMLARHVPGSLVTAPAKVATDVMARFAGDAFRFMAPDAILAEAVTPRTAWLIIDEAAAIPAPLLQQLVQRFPRVLLTTTVQGYEGTGRGFILRFCATLPNVHYFQLDTPLRWAANDPLEQWVSQALLFEDATESAGEGDITVSQASPEQHRDALKAGYRLLASAHYRTSPLDLRRMLDAPGMRFWLAQQAGSVVAALWLVDEGGLDAAVAAAVWAGVRRPRGNLVAQSLAAHAGFAEAATLRSQRITRIAVQAARRQQGVGTRLVAQACAQADCDYLSVSFGYTETLWRFWHRCGFTLVRIGTQREASSGCYAAMAMRALTPAGKALEQRAAQRLARDSLWLRDLIALPLATEPHGVDTQVNEDDWPLLAGFAWAQRPYEASYAALQRLVRCHPQQRLAQLLLEKQPLHQVAARAGLSGRKALIQALRDETAVALSVLDSDAAQQWQARLALLK